MHIVDAPREAFDRGGDFARVVGTRDADVGAAFECGDACFGLLRAYQRDDAQTPPRTQTGDDAVDVRMWFGAAHDDDVARMRCDVTAELPCIGHVGHMMTYLLQQYEKLRAGRRIPLKDRDKHHCALRLLQRPCRLIGDAVRAERSGSVHTCALRPSGDTCSSLPIELPVFTVAIPLPDWS